MKITIGNTELSNGTKYSYEFIRSKIPKIKSNLDKNKLYTTIIVDPDAPSRSHPIYKNFVHLFIINNRDIILDYLSPDPPINSGPHRYYVYIFEQPNKTIIPIQKVNQRPKFDLNNFIEKYRLIKVDEFMFMSERK